MKSLVFFEKAAEEIEHERGWYRERSAKAEASAIGETDLVDPAAQPGAAPDTNPLATTPRVRVGAGERQIRCQL